MGEVWSVVERALDRPLALKIVRADLLGRPSVQERFLAEARATAALEHAGIAPVHQLGTAADGRPWYTMRALSGRTLAEELASLVEPSARAEQLPRAVALLVAVCDCLAYAHARGFVHRDIKPDNVLVGAFGEVTVLDWGLVKPASVPGAGPPSGLAESASKPHPGASAPASAASPAPPGSPDRSTGPRRGFQTRAGGGVGTPGFMAPEQAYGLPLGPPADVYALGATLICLCTGDPPFDVPARAVARAGLPAPLADLCARALDADPARRPADAGAFGRELSAWLDGARLAARRSESVEQAEAAWRAASAADRAVLRELCLRLVDADRHPRALPEARLASLAPDASALVARMVQAGVFRADGGAVSLAERSLPAEWTRLSGWADAEGEGSRLRDRLLDSVPLDGPARGRLDAAELLAVRGWLQSSAPVLSPAERAWIEHSERLVRAARRRLATAAAATVVLSLGAALAMGLLYQQAQRAELAAEAARVGSVARELVARGHELEGQRRPHEALALFHAADALDPGSATTDMARVASLGVQSLVIPAHRAGAWEVVWSTDESRLYSGGADGWIAELDAATGFTLRRIGPHGIDVLQLVEWSGGIASWGFFQPVHLWRHGAAEPERLATLNRAGAGLRLLPDGKRLLTAERGGGVRLWDLDAGTTLAEWHSEDDTRIFRLAVSPDGRFAAFGSFGGEAALVRLPNLEPVATGAVGSRVVGVDFLGSEVLFVGGAGGWWRVGTDGAGGRGGRLTGVADAGHATIAPQGVVVAHDGPQVSVFDAVTLEPRLELLGHSGRAEPSSYATGGARLATAGNDEAILWSTETGAPLAFLDGSTGPVKRVRFTGDGSRLATSSLDGTVRLWTPVFRDREVSLGPGTLPVTELLVDPMAGTLAVRQGDACWLQHGEWQGPIPDCRALLAVAGDAMATQSADGSFRIHRGAKLVASQAAHPGLLSASLSVDPPRWVSSFRDGTVVTLDGPDFGSEHRHQTAIDATVAMTFAASNRVVRSTVSGGPELVNATDGARISALPIDLRAVFFDSQIGGADSGGEAGVSRVAGGAERFSLVDGAPRAPLTDSPEKTILVAYSPNGKHVATTGYDRLLRIYALPAGTLELVAGPYEGVLQGGAFSADGRRFALDTDQGVIRVFDVAEARLLRTIRDAPTVERPLAMLPDGRVAALGASGEWRAWSVDGALPPPWSLTNFRVCPGTDRVVAVVPFPLDDSPWAPGAACDESAH